MPNRMEGVVVRNYNSRGKWKVMFREIGSYWMVWDYADTKDDATKEMNRILNRHKAMVKKSDEEMEERASTNLERSWVIPGSICEKCGSTMVPHVQENETYMSHGLRCPVCDEFIEVYKQSRR